MKSLTLISDKPIQDPPEQKGMMLWKES